MALVTYLIGSCAGGPAILVDFDSSNLPAVNGNYFLRFSGATAEGCYDIIDNAEPTTGVDVVTYMSVDYGDCATCEAVVTPTPTPSTTATPTPSVTKTPTVTPTKTATATPTPSITASPTVTPTKTATPTPSVTAAVTSTPTVTPTNSPTPSTTAGATPTPSVTTTKTPTPTQSGTASVTPTPTGTAAVTPTPTSSVTPTVTPTTTPTPTPFGVFSANTYYEFTDEMFGSYSGGTYDPSLGQLPRPANQAMIGNERGTVYDMSAIRIGGFDGLNN